MESAELERAQQCIEMQKLTAEAEANERCLREEMEEKVRTSHQFTDFALILYHSSHDVVGPKQAADSATVMFSLT